MSVAASQATLSEFVELEVEDEQQYPELRYRLRIRATNRSRRRFWEYHDQRTYECPSCGCGYDEVGSQWEVHHKDRDWLNAHPFNLVALCHSCHRHTHSAVNRMKSLEEWKERFLKLGEDDA